MKKIYKYPIKIVGKQSIKLPKGAVILTVQIQDNKPFIWAYVDPNEIEAEDVTLRIYGTGHEIDDSLDLIYLGTIQEDEGRLVWHVFKID